MNTRTLKTRKASLILLIALMVSYSFVTMTKNCFSSAMVFIVSEGILTKFETGVITAVFYVVYALFQIVGGVVVDKFRPERLMSIGLVGAAVANLLVYFNQNYVFMLTVWALNAIVQLGIWPSTFKLITSTLSEELVERGVFAISFTTPIGAVISYAIAAIVSTRWQLNFLISAITLAVIAVLWEAAIIRTLIPRYTVEREIGGLKDPMEHTACGVSAYALVFSSGFALSLLITLIRTTFDLGIKSLVPTMINESYPEVSPVFSTLIGIIVLIAGAVGPFVARAIYPTHIHNESVALLILLSLTLPLVAFVLFIGKIHYSVIVLLLALVVMLMSGCAVFLNIYVSRFHKYGKDGTMMGITNCAAALGVVIANALFTAIADKWGWTPTIVLWVVMVGVVILLAAMFIPMRNNFMKNYK